MSLLRQNGFRYGYGNLPLYVGISLASSKDFISSTLFSKVVVEFSLLVTSPFFLLFMSLLRQNGFWNGYGNLPLCVGISLASSKDFISPTLFYEVVVELFLLATSPFFFLSMSLLRQNGFWYGYGNLPLYDGISLASAKEFIPPTFSYEVNFEVLRKKTTIGEWNSRTKIHKNNSKET
jgi:hypothetical protein